MNTISFNQGLLNFMSFGGIHLQNLQAPHYVFYSYYNKKICHM